MPVEHPDAVHVILFNAPANYFCRQYVKVIHYSSNKTLQKRRMHYFTDSFTAAGNIATATDRRGKANYSE